MFAEKASRPAISVVLVSASALKFGRRLHTSTVKRPAVLNGPRSRRQFPSQLALNRPQTRPFLTSLPTFLVPPVVFTGLLLALWTYKCLMTVIFQEKILYMSYMPPRTRSETIEDYAATCNPVEWKEHCIQSLDGTDIALAVGSIPRKDVEAVPGKEVVICYFQGNGGSTPPRLPLLSNTIKLVQSRAGESVRFTLVALSYRGYWTSSGRATEPGIKLDAQATLAWIKATYPNASIVLWGQSLGAGVACAAAAQHVTKEGGQPIQGLVLETPFTSVKSMLLALYPERWLPYRYLSGFLRSHWDSEAALRRVAGEGARKPPLVLLVAATRDEVVPAEEAEKIQKVCEDAKLVIKRVNVIGALHNEATTRREGQEAVARFVLETNETTDIP